MKHYGWLVFVGILFTSYVIWAGCSGASSPLIPGNTPGDANLAGSSLDIDQGSTTENPRLKLGGYHVTIDDQGNCAVVEMRQAEAHFNVTSFVFPPGCKDCFTAKILQSDMLGTTWTIQFTLKNPTKITGYDIRAVILDTGSLTLKTAPDSYTPYYALGSNPNPYYIFDSGQDLNVWPPLATGSRTVQIHRPENGKFTEIDVIIDASWPANQPEPVKIHDISLTSGSLHADGSNSTNLSFKIDDWQNDIDGVMVDLTPLGGGKDTPLSFTFSGVWAINGISCQAGTAVGIHSLWITANSGGGKIFNRIEIIVDNESDPGPQPEKPSKWTVMVYMNDPDDFGLLDMDEMETAGSLQGELNILVLRKGGTGNDGLYYIEHDPDGFNQNLISNKINEAGAVIPPAGLDMSKKQTLSNFLSWSILHFPAQHYMLIIRDHSVDSYLQTQQPLALANICGGLDIHDIHDACFNAMNTPYTTNGFSIIGFDVPAMGWIETVRAFGGISEYLITSENAIPDTGWDYSAPMVSLLNHIDTYTSADAAYKFATSYIDSYSITGHPYHSVTNDCTMSVISCQDFQTKVLPAFNQFADTCASNLPDVKNSLTNARTATSYWGISQGVSDIGHFAYECSMEPGITVSIAGYANVLIEALNSAVLIKTQNTGVPANASGYKIWFPSNIGAAQPELLEFYVGDDKLNFDVTRWDDFLYAFSGGSPVISGWLSLEGRTFDDSAGGNGNGKLEADETINIYLTVKNSGYAAATNVTGTLSIPYGSETEYELISPTQSFSDIPSGETRSNTDPFVIHILDTAVPDTLAQVLLDLVCAQSETKDIGLNIPIDPADCLVINLDTDNSSTPAMVYILDDVLGWEVATQEGGRIADAALDLYPMVFIAMGMFAPDDYAPDLYDYEAVNNYLKFGGKIYMEGGDAWYWNPYYNGCPNFNPLFGLDATQDGKPEDIHTILGKPGTLMTGLSLSYTGFNDFPDYLVAEAGTLFMSNDVPEYGIMVGYDSGTYRTIAFSGEFGGIEDTGIPNTKYDLMLRIIAFLMGP